VTISLIHLISLGTSLCLALRALLCNVQFGSPAKLSSQARSASSGTSQGAQILIDPLDLEYKGISSIPGKLYYYHIIQLVKSVLQDVTQAS